MAAARIDGQTTISTDGGALSVTGLTGALEADSGGGPAYLFDVTAQTATVTTGGGAGRLQFGTAPGSVVLSTDGGPGQLDVPGGPYALTSDSDGGPETVTVATSPSASRTLAVTSGGGLLQVDHATGTRAARVLKPADNRKGPPAPPSPPKPPAPPKPPVPALP
jgi:hypothetical protein